MYIHVLQTCDDIDKHGEVCACCIKATPADTTAAPEPAASPPPPCKHAFLARGPGFYWLHEKK